MVDDRGHLTIGGCDLLELARTFGTPTYVIDEDDIRSRARTYVQAFARLGQDAEVAFASKSLPVSAVLRWLAEEGLSCEATTGGELALALGSGFDAARMLFHGNARTDQELKMALDAGVGRVVIDSFDDIDRLERLAQRPQRVLLRVQSGVRPKTHASQSTGHFGSKFGLGPERAHEAIVRLGASDVLELEGLHSHIGSQILDLDSFRDAVKRLGDFGDFPVYDLGGGLGVTYRDKQDAPTIDAYVEALVDAVRTHLGMDKHILVEPGRSLVASGCVTIYSVVTVKRDQVTHVAVDGGTSDNLEAVLGIVTFEAAIADRLAQDEGCVVVGKHCDSGDVIVPSARLANPRIGDVLVVPATGAYGHGMANNYNCVPRPPVVVCRDGEARLAVRRETLGDLFQRDLELGRGVGTVIDDAY
ncbi:MAG: diaminopimelate decarboxylase [Actinomycetota bacterium]